MKDKLRILVGILSICFIISMWVSKDLFSIYNNVPTDELLPLIITNIIVSLLKILGIAAVVLVVKKIVKMPQR